MDKNDKYNDGFTTITYKPQNERKPYEHLINYTICQIYKIVCKDENIKDIYVGQTCNFTRRKSTHKSCCNNENNNKRLYKFIRENGGWNNWDMSVIEYYPCDNQKQAEEREQYWIRTLGAILNKRIYKNHENH